jgi:Winged helix-turn helix
MSYSEFPEESMRPSGSPQELERRRFRALALLREGLSPVEVARRVGADRRSVRRWKASARARGSRALAARPAPGRPQRLSAAWKKICFAAHRPPVLKPNCGPARVCLNGLLAVSMCTITPITSVASCMAWAGVPKSPSAAPSSGMKKPFATGCAIPGVPLKKSPPPECLAGVSR